MRKTLLAAGLFGALALASAAHARAEVSDADLKAFGAAMTQVQKINAEYTPKMTGADGPTKDSLQREMISKMGAAVSASGLSPEKYNEISTAVQTDEALRQRLVETLQQAD